HGPGDPPLLFQRKVPVYCKNETVMLVTTQPQNAHPENFF
ncbi:uncharacterized protein METZ01_LOCUS387481, partial [marine metagenome]